MIFGFFHDFWTNYSFAICRKGNAKTLSLGRFKSAQQKQVVCDNRTANVSDETIPSRPSTPEKAESPFEYGDVGFDAGSKVSELFVDPGAFDHLKNGKPLSFCEGNILYSLCFPGLEVCFGGKTGIGRHLPGRASKDLFLAIHEGQEHG